MGDFNPGFSFDFGPSEGPSQAPWEFSGVIQQAMKDQKASAQATTIDQKIQKRLQEMQKEKWAKKDKRAKAAAAKKAGKVVTKQGQCGRGSTSTLPSVLDNVSSLPRNNQPARLCLAASLLSVGGRRFAACLLPQATAQPRPADA